MTIHTTRISTKHRHSRKKTERNVLNPDAHSDPTESDHGKQAVPEHTGRAVGVDPGFGHDVEEEIDGGCAECCDAVDV